MTRTDADRRLSPIADDFWRGWLAAHPTEATVFGVRGYDHLLPDISSTGDERRRGELRELERRLEAIDQPALEPAESVTLAALREAVLTELAFLDADATAHTVDPLAGPQVTFLNLPHIQPMRDADDAVALLARWRAMAPWLDELIARLRSGLREGRTGVEILVRRTLEELDGLLARPVDDWPLARPAEREGTAAAGAPGRFGEELRRVVADQIRPAFERYRRFLEGEALPAARPAERPGLLHLSRGERDYRLLVRAHTSLDVEPGALHRLGLTEIERIDAELTELGRRLLGTAGLAETLERLRGDVSLSFTARDEVFEIASRSLERATAAIGEWFGRLPRAGCAVVAMQPHEERHSTIAYYREPAADGSRPGEYHINTSEPETRPRYEAEALAFHESIPGHHLQIAIAQELQALPAFRRFLGSTAFVEGWGLYAERLSDEMGLYSGDLDRFGILSFDAWRASRLVVDTGMHALGWSRQQAIDFMREHTALAPTNIANEVDRYIAWPAQALAYKVGQLELLRLRDEARARLGAAFDVRRFHDALLGEGALPLAVLRAAVETRLGES